MGAPPRTSGRDLHERHVVQDGVSPGGAASPRCRRDGPGPSLGGTAGQEQESSSSTDETHAAWTRDRDRRFPRGSQDHRDRGHQSPLATRVHGRRGLTSPEAFRRWWGEESNEFGVRAVVTLARSPRHDGRWRTARAGDPSAPGMRSGRQMRSHQPGSTARRSSVSRIVTPSRRNASCVGAGSR